jgi:hypothetical protein
VSGHRISWVYTALWLVFICVMVFGVLNILTGIFVDAATQDEKEQAQKVLKLSFDKSTRTCRAS